MSMAIYPLAIPLPAQSRWHRDPHRLLSRVTGAVVDRSACGYGADRRGDRLRCVPDLPLLYKNVSTERIMVTEKLLGIFLAALAVQLMVNGLEELRIIAVAAH